MIMPKKLKAVLARAVLSTLGYTCSLIAIEGFEALLPGPWVLKCKLAAGATFLGFLLFYAWLTGADLQNIPSALLMRPEQLLSGNALQHRDTVITSLGSVPFRP